MKEVKMFMFEGCPHCPKAAKMMEEIFAEHPEYTKVPLTVIDERKNPEIASQYDYYYVPTFFAGGLKMIECVPDKEAIRKVFAKAIE